MVGQRTKIEYNPKKPINFTFDHEGRLLHTKKVNMDNLPPHATQALEITNISPITNLTEVAKKEKEAEDARLEQMGKRQSLEGYMNNPDVITINIDKITAASSNKGFDQLGSHCVS